ncbi:MAG: branched-chain amino acid ABC transporter permease [Proteobacteria bacterium]|mgnify:FL=1|jgi:branched-chain amino acid transport system permease protein|nr:branched-chain amino acid ABC transporter permease [Pseudomonadota bacterium]
MFKNFRFTNKTENILMLAFTLIFLAYISTSPDMNIESIKGVLLIGITVGIIYGLVAVGISLIYTGLDIVNFSHGEFFMLGAFTGLTVYNFLIDGELIYKIFPEAYGWIGYVIGLFFAFVVMGLLGVLIERLFFRPLTRKGGGYTVAGMGIIICGFGMSVILQNAAYLIWNPTAKPFNADLGLPIEIGGIVMPMTYLWMLVAGFTIAGALYLFLTKTKMGLGVRAVAYSKDISNLVGINVPLYISIIFGIACALAGIAGTLVGPTYQVIFYMGYIILLKAFAAAVVGGFGSLPGAIVGGFTVGLFETLCAFFISGSHKDAYAFLLMIVVLLIKPTGFFGVQVKMKA